MSLDLLASPENAAGSVGEPPKLALSVIVIVYNMRREAARTLHSLTPTYQHGISPDEYEVLVMENGSTEPLAPEAVAKFGSNFRYLPVPEPTHSPAGAVNFGLRQARGTLAGIMIDGARLASPGLLASALSASRLHPRTIVATTSWHLGPSTQHHSPVNGYDQRREDSLLTAINWPDGDNYRLFEIAAPAGSARRGIFRVPGESNFLCLPRSILVDELGGCDERFDMPGGGLVNQDLFRRACDLPDSELVLLLGEATFHQLHGGISTNPNVAMPASLGQQWLDHYEKLRGEPFTHSLRTPRFFGHLPHSLAPAAEWSARLSAALENTTDYEGRKRLIQAAVERDAASRHEHQRWLLLGKMIPDNPDAADTSPPIPPRLPTSPDAPPPPNESFFTKWLSRPKKQPLALPRRKKTLLFFIKYSIMQGAHLKTWHYFQHAKHSAEWEPRVVFHPEMVWDNDNPWLEERARALPAYVPGEADALFIDHRHTWIRLPADQRENWPAPIVCLIQGFRHINPQKTHIDYLRCRAVRICVGEEVRLGIVGTGRVRGPTFTIPNGTDLPIEVAADSSPAWSNDLFIAGLKNPELGAEIETELRALGWRVQSALGRMTRKKFLSELRRADAALLLPAIKEGFYLPALEAMALGTCVICPDVIGNRSFCLDGINCLRPAYTKAALLAACAALRGQSFVERERMLAQARETAARYSLEHEREKFLRILDNLPSLWAQKTS